MGYCSTILVRVLTDPNGGTTQMTKTNYSRNHSRYMGTLVNEYLGTPSFGESTHNDPGQPGKARKSSTGRSKPKKPSTSKRKRKRSSASRPVRHRDVRANAEIEEASRRLSKKLRHLSDKLRNGIISESAYCILKRKIITENKNSSNPIDKENSKPKKTNSIPKTTGPNTSQNATNAKQGKPRPARNKKYNNAAAGHQPGHKAV
jgi:hypothetical protein